MSVATLSIHTVTIQHDIGVSDGAGGYGHSWSDKYANVACRIQPKSAAEQAKWSGLPVIATHTIYFADTSLEWSENAQILFGTRVFDVLGVRNIDERDTFLTVDVREIR